VLVLVVQGMMQQECQLPGGSLRSVLWRIVMHSEHMTQQPHTWDPSTLLIRTFVWASTKHPC
jgi:hypothetical protein